MLLSSDLSMECMGIFMGVEIRCEENKLFAYITGELDHHTAKEIRCEIDTAAEREQPRELVLDFSGVTFMDSSGIGLVMGRYKLMSAVEGKVFIQNPPPPIRRVMQIAGISRLAKIIDAPLRAAHTSEKLESNTIAGNGGTE
ncbi:MAG: anti-sigma factor antagonist [Oscillospiraceae bacterium]